MNVVTDILNLLNFFSIYFSEPKRKLFYLSKYYLLCYDTIVFYISQRVIKDQIVM